MYMLIHTYAYTYLGSVPFQVHFEKKKQLNVSLMNLYVGTILCTPQDAPSVNAYPSADTSQAPKSPLNDLLDTFDSMDVSSDRYVFACVVLFIHMFTDTYICSHVHAYMHGWMHTYTYIAWMQ